MKRAKIVVAALAALVALLTTSVALADNLKTDLDAVLSNDQTTQNLGPLAGGTAQTVPVLIYLQETGTNNTTLPISVSGSGNLGAAMAGVTISSYGKVNGQTGEIKFTTPAATSTTQNYTISFGFSTASDNVNTSPAAVSLTFSVPAGASAVAPTVSYVVNPATPDGTNGWYKTGPVTLTWTVTGTPTPTRTGCVDQTITADQVKTTYSCSATNSAGTASDQAEVGLDSTAPTNIAFIGGPAAGQTYYQDDVPAEPTCSASDATSGLGSCSVTDYSTAIGPHTMIATATDNAGNTATATRTYTIDPWTAAGYHSPVRMGTDVVNTIKGGSTVPLKFNVFKGATEIVDVTKLGIAPFSVTAYKCDAGDAPDPVDQLTTGGTALRYSETQFVQNWKTPTTKGCYRAIMTLPYGAGSIVAQFQVK